MQIAVGIDRHRCLVAQLKNRSGYLARMEITDVAALRRFRIEPLDMVDIHHRIDVYKRQALRWVLVDIVISAVVLLAVNLLEKQQKAGGRA